MQIQAVAKSDMLEAIRTRKEAMEGHTAAPSAAAAFYQLARDELVIAELPGETSGEMKAHLQAEARAANRKQWQLAGVGLALFAMGGTGLFLKAPMSFNLPLVLGGATGVIAGGITGDRVSRANYKTAVVEQWEGYFNRPSPEPEEHPFVLHNTLEGAAATNLKSELVNVMQSTRAYLEKRHPNDPAAWAAVARLHGDQHFIESFEGEELPALRQRLIDENEAHADFIRKGTVAALAGGGLALGIGIAAGVTGWPLQIPAFVCAGVSVVSSIKTGLTQDKQSRNSVLLATLDRWEPLLETQKRIAGAGDDLRSLAQGPAETGEITVEDDGLQVGDVFIPF